MTSSSESAPIQSISIPKTENRTLPTPHTVYAVLITLPVRSWFVFRRYSEFLQLHQTFCNSPNRFQNPPPSPFPPKNVTRTAFKTITGLGGLIRKGESEIELEKEQLRQRKEGLEAYLRSILSSSENCWRESDEFKEFIELPKGQSLSALLGKGQSEHKINSSTGNGYTRGMGRSMPGSLPKEEKGLGSFTRTLGETRQVQETDQTRTLNDHDLMSSQQAQMDSQDRQLDGLAAILGRQKAMGLAINQELSEQTELLDDLDGQVDKTQSKMHSAERQMDKLK